MFSLIHSRELDKQGLSDFFFKLFASIEKFSLFQDCTINKKFLVK